MFKGLQLLKILVFSGFLIIHPIISLAEVVVVGGQDGLSWQSGGGTIPATIILSGSSVEHSDLSFLFSHSVPSLSGENLLDSGTR